MQSMPLIAKEYISIIIHQKQVKILNVPTCMHNNNNNNNNNNKHNKNYYIC